MKIDHKLILCAFAEDTEKNQITQNFVNLTNNWRIYHII